jgi:hypothetical protein
MKYLLFLFPIALFVIVIYISRKKRFSISKDSHISKSKEKRKTLFDLFDIDLQGLLINNYEYAEEEITDSGDKIKVYEIDLSDNKPFGLFDTAKVIQTSSNAYNVTFFMDDPDMASKILTKNMINHFVRIYGLDDNGKRGFEVNEWEEYMDSNYNVLWGRRWSDYSKFKNPVVIQRDEFHLELTIWGLKR